MLEDDDGADLETTLGAYDTPAPVTDVSAQSRARAPIDFSDLLPPQAPASKPSAKSRQPIDFSDLLPKVPTDQVPLPAPRPAEAPIAVPPPINATPEHLVPLSPGIEQNPWAGAQEHADRGSAIERVMAGEDPSAVTSDLARNPAAVQKREPLEVEKGFTGGLIGTNPKLLGHASEAFGVLLDNDTLKTKGSELAASADKTLESYKARVPSFVDIRTDSVGNFLSDLGSYAGYQSGAGIGTSVPSLATGGLAALATRNPFVGLAVGAAGPSYIQNLGDVYGSAKEDKDIAARVTKGELTPKQLAATAALAAIPMAALDIIGLETVMGKTVFATAKQDLTRRILKGIAIGAITEGSTEGLQEVVSQWTQHYLGSQTTMKQKFIAVVDNVLGGIFAGGPMGGVGAAANRGKGAPPATAPAEAPPSPFAPPAGAAPSVAAAPDGTPIAANTPPVVEPAVVLPDTNADTATPSNVSGVERRLLRKRGYSEDDISAMTPDQVDAAVAAVAEPTDEQPAQITAVDEETKPASLGAETGEPAAPQAQMPDDKASPITDVSAQRVAPATEAARAAAVDFSDLLPDGSRGRAARVTDASDIERAAARVNTEPSEAQKVVGNYTKGHLKLHGLDITIENPKGSIRSGTSPDGSTWQAEMPAAYGYLKRTTGRDGDQVDVYLGDQPSAPNAFVIDQYDPATGRLDEHKVMLGFPDEATAQRVYNAAFSDSSGPQRGLTVNVVPIEELKRWLREGDTRRPYGQRVAPHVARRSAMDVGAQATPPSTQQGSPPADTVAPAERPAPITQTAGAGNGVTTLTAEPSPVAPQSAQPIGGPVEAAAEPTADALIDARENVEEALNIINVPARVVDPADVEAAARIVATTGAEPGEAFQRVMAAQLDQETDNAKPTAVSGRVEDRPEGGQRPKGDELPGRGEVRGEGDQGRPPAESPAVARPGNASETDALRSGNPEKAEDAGVTAARSTYERARAENEKAKAALEAIGEPKPGTVADRAADGLRKRIARTQAIMDRVALEGVREQSPSVPAPAPSETPKPAASPAPAPAAEPAPAPSTPTEADLEIPPFLRRAKVKAVEPAPSAAAPEPIATQKPSEPASAPAAPVPVAQLTPEQEIHAEADKRWRNWMPSREHPTRPRLATFEKIIRREQRIAARDEKRAAKPKRRAEQDAPTWAQVLGELPMSKDGRTRQHEIAFDIIAEITGNKRRPKFDDLTPAQKTQLFERVKERRADAKMGAEALSVRQAPGLYSAVARAVENSKQPKASPDQWLATLRNTPGVKQEEMDWLGLADWLREQKGAVTREAVADYVRANQIEVKEVEKVTNFLGPDGKPLAGAFSGEGETKFGQYTLPGGENYRELLLTLPRENKIAALERQYAEMHDTFQRQGRRVTDEQEAEWDRLGAEIGAARKRGEDPGEGNYRSSHFDEPNVLSHIRFNDRTIDGKKTLFIEEVQSDWHQAGKRKGYNEASNLSAEDRARLEAERDEISSGAADADLELKRRYDEEYQQRRMSRATPDERTAFWAPFHDELARDPRQQRWSARINEINAALGEHQSGVPDAPFKTTWPELAMKRMIRFAAEHGYDKIAWTPGGVQAERYDLSKQVASINAVKRADGSFMLQGTHAGGGSEFRIADHVPQEKLGDHVGKDLAEKIVERGGGEFSGLDLKVGGEGMKGFYDKILPATVNRLVKKFGAKVGTGTLESDKPFKAWLRETYGNDWRDQLGSEEVTALREKFRAMPRPSEFEDFNMPAARIVPAEASGFRIEDPADRDMFGRGWFRTREDAQAFIDESRAPAGWATVETSTQRGSDSGAVHTLDITPDLRRAALGEGFPMFRLRSDSAAQGKRTAIQEQLSEIVERMVGRRVEVRFEDTIPANPDGAWGSYGDSKQTAAGSYSPAHALIRLAMADPKYAGQSRTTAYHESFHAVEHLLWREEGAERAVLEREHDRLENWIVQNMQFEGGITKAQLQEMAGYEVRAIAFEGYAQRREAGQSTGGIHTVFRAAFERLMQMLRRVRNYLEGHGYKTAEDVFSDVYEGKVRERADRAERSTMAGAAEAADRGERYSVRRTEAESAILERIVPSETGPSRSWSFTNVYTKIKDDLNPIRLLRNELAGDRKVQPERDPYLLARLSRGSYGKARQFLENGTFNFETLRGNGPSLKHILARVKNDLDGLRAYAVAKRSLELDERGVKTGVPIDAARQTVETGADRYETVFRDLVGYQRRLTEYLNASGILSDEGYAAMLEANRDYVPFFRFFGETELGQGLGAGLRVKDPVKGIRGSERQIIDPIESIIKNTFLFVSLAERNRSLVALDDLARASPRGDELMAKVEDKTAADTATEARELITAEGVDAKRAGSLALLQPKTFQPAPGQIALFRDGKRELRAVDPEVAEAVNALDREALGLVARIAAIPARLLRAGATLTPEFIARNPVRDAFHAFVLSKNGNIPVYDFARGLGAIIGKTESYQQWLAAGGANATMVSLDRDTVNDVLREIGHRNIWSGTAEDIAKARTGIAKTLIAAGFPFRLADAYLIDPLRAMSELTENATRVGEFKRAVGKGKTLFEAAYDAREVTLDFARMGDQMRALNAITAFLNARVEGLDRTVRGFGERPVASTVKAIAAITLPSVLLWMWNHDDPRWKELAAWERDLFWIILTDKWVPITAEQAETLPDGYKRKVGDQWQRNDGNIWRIPKPFELGVVFGSLPERILDAYVDKSPKAMKQIGKTLLSQLNPGIPQILVPLIEQFANRSTFTERPIVPRYLDNVKPPYQVTPYTSETGKLLGKLIASTTWDTNSFASPPVLENYVRNWTGGLGMYVLKAADIGLKAVGAVPKKIDPEPVWADMPLIRGFATRFPSANMQSVQDFYETYDERKKNAGTVRYLARTGQEQAAEREAATNSVATAEQIHRALGAHFKMVREVYANKDMTAREKRQMIDDLYLRAAGLAQAGNKVFEQTKKQ